MESRNDAQTIFQFSENVEWHQSHFMLNGTCLLHYEWLIDRFETH